MSAQLVDQAISWATTLIIATAAIWVALWIYQSMRQKSLNLTTSETVSRHGVEPGFLTVDQEKRDAALKAGEAFDHHVAERDAPTAEDGVAKCKGYARLFTILLALVSLVTGTIGALMRIEAYDDAVKKFGVWDSATAIIAEHLVGFAIAIGVIGLVAFNFVRVLRSEGRLRR